MGPMKPAAVGLFLACGLGRAHGFHAAMPNTHLIRHGPTSVLPSSLRSSPCPGRSVGLQMQLEARSGRRIGSTRLPAVRKFSPGPLRYKVEQLPDQEADPLEAGVGELPPLDWRGKPVDSLRSLLSDYAPLMNEKDAFAWLLFVVALCGINFPLTKYVGEFFDGPTLLTARFAIAAVCFSPWFRDIKNSAIPAGVETGMWLSAGYIAQAECLMGGTNSGVASFFASMSCVLCPFFERVVGVKLSWRAWAAAATGLLSAFVLELGPGILDGNSGVGDAAMPTVSDLVGLLQPAFFGLYLFRTERAMQRIGEAEAMPLTAIQVLVTAVICGAWGSSQALAGGLPAFGKIEGVSLEGLRDLSGLEDKLPAILGLLWMGVLPSGLSLALETVIVHKLSSSVTALTFTLEPVFAAVFGSFFLGEDFGLATAVGGALAISAVLIRCADPQQLRAAAKETAEGIWSRLDPRNT